MKGKKGQLGNLPAIIGTLVVVGILIGTGFLVLQEFQEQDSLFSSKSVTNESDSTGDIAFANQTGYTLAVENGGQTKSFTLTAVWADTGTDGNGYNVTVPLANVSVDSTTGLVTNATVTEYDNVSLSYTYNKGTNSWQGVNDTVEATQTIPNLLGLIVLIIIIGIVLAIVFNVIPGTGRVSGA